MPLTKTGKEVLENMKKQYGSDKGESVFYASINAKKEGSEKWHGREPHSGHKRKRKSND